MILKYKTKMFRFTAVVFIKISLIDIIAIFTCLSLSVWSSFSTCCSLSKATASCLLLLWVGNMYLCAEDTACIHKPQQHYVM